MHDCLKNSAKLVYIVQYLLSLKARQMNFNFPFGNNEQNQYPFYHLPPLPPFNLPWTYTSIDFPPPNTSINPQNILPFLAPQLPPPPPPNFYVNQYYNNYYSFAPNYPTFNTNISPHPSFQKLMRLPLPKAKDDSKHIKVKHQQEKTPIEKAEKGDYSKVIQISGEIDENRQKKFHYENEKGFFQLKRLSNKKFIKKSADDVMKIQIYVNQIEQPRKRKKIIEKSYYQLDLNKQYHPRLKRKIQREQNNQINMTQQNSLINSLKYEVDIPQILSKQQLQQSKKILKQNLLSRSLQHL